MRSGPHGRALQALDPVISTSSQGEHSVAMDKPDSPPTTSDYADSKSKSLLWYLLSGGGSGSNRYGPKSKVRPDVGAGALLSTGGAAAPHDAQPHGGHSDRNALLSTPQTEIGGPGGALNATSTTNRGGQLSPSRSVSPPRSPGRRLSARLIANSTEIKYLSIVTDILTLAFFITGLSACTDATCAANVAAAASSAFHPAGGSAEAGAWIGGWFTICLAIIVWVTQVAAEGRGTHCV
jgi:hypothetical protein